MLILPTKYITLCRPSHWIKNFLIFVPLIFDQKLLSSPHLIETIATFLLFCVSASSVYAFNDAHDKKADSQHQVKQNRPVACGKISRFEAKVFSLLLCVTALLSAAFISSELTSIIAIYFFLNILYTLFLKGSMINDVFCLSIFFLLRCFAGANASNSTLSHWVIIIVFLLSMFLGVAKRRQDLTLSSDEEKIQITKVNSAKSLYDQILTTLIPSIAVVYMLYTVDRTTTEKYQTSALIYTIPFVYYGLFRYLLLIHVDRKGDDPVTVLLSDTGIKITIVLWAISCMVIIYL